MSHKGSLANSTLDARRQYLTHIGVTLYPHRLNIALKKDTSASRMYPIAKNKDSNEST